MSNQKRETISVSFHYLRRIQKSNDGSVIEVPFSQLSFDSLFDAASSRPPVDILDPEAADRLRYRLDVPLEKVERINTRTVFGNFKASYWGHAYDNTAKGQIPADSISLRPFYFLLYLAENGRIYVGSQYLGQFGGYNGLQRTVCDILGNPQSIESHSFRIGAGYYKDALAREVRVTFSEKPRSIASGNKFGSSGMIVFQRSSKGDDFENIVKKKLLPVFGKPKSEVQKAVAALASESELIDVQDSEIEDCAVIAMVNGKRKTIQLMEGGSFATKFPIDVPLTAHGHPEREPARRAMLELLEAEIISRNGSV